MIEIIISQGRIGDRTARTIEGAALTARALKERYDVPGVIVRGETRPVHDDWRDSLHEARETLIGLGTAVQASISRGSLTVMVANTCSASLATLPVVARSHPNAVVLWVDAHGDFNTPETTRSGYLGGMVLSGACGLWDSGHGAGLKPNQAMVVGARDIDPAEHELLRQSGVRIIPPKDATPAAIVDAIDGAPVWVHVDWDVIEPGFIPADYKVPGGIFPAQLREIFRAIPESQLLGLEVAEFHPTNDETQNQTAVHTILDTIAPILEGRRG